MTALDAYTYMMQTGRSRWPTFGETDTLLYRKRRGPRVAVPLGCGEYTYSTGRQHAEATGFPSFESPSGPCKTKLVWGGKYEGWTERRPLPMAVLRRRGEPEPEPERTPHAGCEFVESFPVMCRAVGGFEECKNKAVREDAYWWAAWKKCKQCRAGPDFRAPYLR